jgi:hypothetical protein
MQNFDVIIAGAGAGGICAAVAAARTGAKTLLIEKATEIGGTGVHSPVSLICKFHGTDHRPINLGIHRELFFEAYRYSTRDRRASAPRLTYDEHRLLERYKELIADEPLLEVRTGLGASKVVVKDRRITKIVLEDESEVSADVYIDGTADGVLGAMAGCDFELGRMNDGAMQSATLVFGVSEVDRSQLKQPDYSTRGGLDSLWKELTPLLHAAQQSGTTKNPRKTVVAFPYPDGERLLFNSNAMTGVDPTRPENVKAAIEAGHKQIDELVDIIRQHPAFASCKVDFVASKLGVREGRRIRGDYVLTQEDCLGEARFDDMLCACAYELDIHDPQGGDAQMIDIPGSGYYHIPQRSLVAADLDNLLMGSRCISGSHEAHSSYRVMSGVTAIGQAAGTLAALGARSKSDNIREVDASQVRYVLREQVQFVEGECRQPEGWVCPKI